MSPGFLRKKDTGYNSIIVDLTNLGADLAYPMMRDPKTDPMPAPDPATPTVAAPAPMNLAAANISGSMDLLICTSGKEKNI